MNPPAAESKGQTERKPLARTQQKMIEPGTAEAEVASDKEDEPNFYGTLATIDHNEIGNRYLVTAFNLPAPVASTRW